MDLVLGGDAGDHADVVQLPERLVVGHRAELGARDRAARDPEVLGDRLGGDGVVAGDHPDLDAGAVRVGDRHLGRRPRRVDDADEGQQRHAVEQRQHVGLGVEGLRIEVLATRGHDPQALRPEALVLVEVALLHRVVDARDAGQVRRDDRRAAGEQLVGGALDEGADDVLAALVLHRVEGGHHLVGGVEREGRDARVRLAGGDRGDPALLGEHDQRALGRVADEVAVLHDRVGGQDAREQERVQRARRCRRRPAR